MADDFEQEVTLKLRKRMRTVFKEVDGKQAVTMEPTESVEVWLPKKRKPSAILVNHESRSGVLRDLASWIEMEEDPLLEKLIEKMAANES
jgi:hypothetical protein